MKIKKFKFCVALIIIAFLFFEAITYAAYRKYTNDSEEAEKDYRLQINIELSAEQAELSTEELDTLNLINEYRNKNGLDSLKTNDSLQKVAKLKAEDLLYNDYFAHDSEQLGTPFQMLKSNGVEYRIAGENLAGNTTPERAVDAWINSESHRANILEEKYQYTGIYVIDSEEYGKIFVQLFVGV